MDEWANTARQTKQLSYTRFRTRMTRRFLQFLNKYIYISHLESVTYAAMHGGLFVCRASTVLTCSSRQCLLAFSLFSLFLSPPPFRSFSFGNRSTEKILLACQFDVVQRDRRRALLCVLLVRIRERRACCLWAWESGRMRQFWVFRPITLAYYHSAWVFFLLQAKMTPATCSLQAVSHWFMLHFLLLHI